MKLDFSRLKYNILKIGKIGTTNSGGITRLAFSDEYFSAAALFGHLLEDAGLEVHIDGVGNVIGEKKGKKTNEIIMIGSHLDTVVEGGMFDGNIGAVAALEFAYFLKDNNIELNHTLKVVGFNAEEGGDMGGTFGSRVAMGLVNFEDKDLLNKLNKYELDIDDLKRSIIDSDKIKCFLELHIEQGNRLYENDISIGIVSGIVGITRYKITVTGESNHSGTTIMKSRKDALHAFAQFVVLANEHILRVDENLVGTFGTVNIYPNMANVIPGRVEAIVELRHMEQRVIDETVDTFKAIARDIEIGQFTFEKEIEKKSCECDTNIVKIIREICIDNSIDYEVMHSGAGHDANAIAMKKVPVGMVFVPSVEGKSHCPDELTEWKDIEKGCEVLFKTILKIDKRMYDRKFTNEGSRYE